MQNPLQRIEKCFVTFLALQLECLGQEAAFSEVIDKEVKEIDVTNAKIFSGFLQCDLRGT